MKATVGICTILLAGMAFGQATDDSVVKVAGVSYEKLPGRLYVPIRAIEKPLKVYVGWNNDKREITIDEKPIDADHYFKTYDGTNMVDVFALNTAGLKVEPGPTKGSLKISSAKASVIVAPGEKYVEISLKDQRLVAWQGEWKVMETHVSTGRSGYGTPVGDYTAGPEKSRYRVSRKYDDAPMPYAVQLKGGYFVHGSGSVPRYPASHGCVRMPLVGQNAAKYFFNWVDIGTSISITREWSDKALELMKPEDETIAGKKS